MVYNMLKRVSASQFTRHPSQRSAALDAARHLRYRIVQAEMLHEISKMLALLLGMGRGTALCLSGSTTRPHQQTPCIVPCRGSCNNLAAVALPHIIH